MGIPVKIEPFGLIEIEFGSCQVDYANLQYTEVYFETLLLVKPYCVDMFWAGHNDNYDVLYMERHSPGIAIAMLPEYC